MDIQIFENNTLRIKSKKTTIALNPKKEVSKFDADAILLNDINYDTSRVNNYRIIIDAAGEYEISGLKISAISSGENILYGLSSEETNTLIANASSLNETLKDKLSEYQVVIINVDSDLNQSVVTAIEPRIVVLYGNKKLEGAKLLGKENAPKSSKISLSEDKFPEELDVMLLG
jgi:hypothetical protein